MTPSAAAHDGYAALAPLYDEFVAHPGYRHWVLGIEATVRELGTGGVRLLDLGCGTGRSFAPLLERGYEVTGCEPVGPMLAEARRRSPRRVRTVCGLAADAPAGPFDVVLALNDVVNCIPDGAELRRTLAAIADRLAPGGVFAFDVTPPASHALAFGHGGEKATARARFEWRPLPRVDGGHHLAELRVRSRRRPEAVTVHRQRVLAAAELEQALAQAGLRVAALRGCDNAGRLGEPDPDAFKHLYFTRLADPRRRKEGSDAAGTQAARQGARHAVDHQDRLMDGRQGAAAAAAPRARRAGVRDGR